MKLIVTANGNLGSAVARRLLTQGRFVRRTGTQPGERTR